MADRQEMTQHPPQCHDLRQGLGSTACDVCHGLQNQPCIGRSDGASMS